jgi:hypothetical protein
MSILRVDERERKSRSWPYPLRQRSSAFLEPGSIIRLANRFAAKRSFIPPSLFKQLPKSHAKSRQHVAPFQIIVLGDEPRQQIRLVDHRRAVVGVDDYEDCVVAKFARSQTMCCQFERVLNSGEFSYEDFAILLGR